MAKFTEGNLTRGHVGDSEDGERISTVAEISSSVNLYLMEFEKLANQSIIKIGTPCSRWKPPPANYYKINVDASFYDSSKQGGWGFISHDCEGNFLEEGAGNVPRVASALQAETLGVLRSLERAAELGMTRIILETDAGVVGKAIMSSELDRSPNGYLFRQIRELIMPHFVHCIVTVCPRTCNSVADSLASYGCTLEQNSSRYMSHTPDFVSSLVSSDWPRASD
uniref:RNase H type-1 domain-containing protein n=1 Tax=Setaria italica TaxID=4555 RepID=K3Y2V9_SETIT